MESKIRIVQEPSCGNLWCIAVNGWYLKYAGSNRTFKTKDDAEKYCADNNLTIKEPKQ